MTKEIIKVKVNGREYDTYLDEHDTQRFLSNQLIRHLTDTIVDLNKLSIQYQKGKFSLLEYMEFYMGLGYTVSGFEEVFCQGDAEVKIENPLWE